MKKEPQRLKKSIIDYLKAKKLYEKTDNVLIDELVFQTEILNAAKADVLTRGIQVNVRSNDNPLMQINQSVAIANKCIRNIQSLYRQLALAPQDRLKLKPEDMESEFDLNKFLNS